MLTPALESLGIDLRVRRLHGTFLPSRPERLVDPKRLQAAYHTDCVDLTPPECRSGEGHRRFGSEDRGGKIFVGAFEARREVHDIADDRIVEAPPRSDVADECLAGIQSDPVAQRMTLEGGRGPVELLEPLA